MDFKKKASLIIYRFRERGLEVFMLNKDLENWELPNTDVNSDNSRLMASEDRLIALDPVEQANGEPEEAWAVEGDWHEIPSLKSMLYEDAVLLKEKIKEMESGTFVVLKDAVKKVLPHQYKLLKELKDILRDRNSVKDM